MIFWPRWRATGAGALSFFSFYLLVTSSLASCLADLQFDDNRIDGYGPGTALKSVYWWPDRLLISCKSKWNKLIKVSRLFMPDRPSANLSTNKEKDSYLAGINVY